MNPIFKTEFLIVRIYPLVMYPSFTNISHTSVSGIFQPHFADTSCISSIKIWVVLSLNRLTILEAKLVAELLWTLLSATCAVSSIVIVMPLCTRYGSLLSAFLFFHLAVLIFHQYPLPVWKRLLIASLRHTHAFHHSCLSPIPWSSIPLLDVNVEMFIWVGVQIRWYFRSSYISQDVIN